MGHYHRWASLIKKLVSLIVNPLTKKLVPLNDNPLIHNKSNGSYFSPLIVNILHGNNQYENACAFFHCHPATAGCETALQYYPAPSGCANSPLTIIPAPPGCGKSPLLSSPLHQSPSHAPAGCGNRHPVPSPPLPSVGTRYVKISPKSETRTEPAPHIFWMWVWQGNSPSTIISAPSGCGNSPSTTVPAPAGCGNRPPLPSPPLPGDGTAPPLSSSEDDKSND